MKKSRLFSLMVVAMVTVLILSGCNSTGEKPSTTAPVAKPNASASYPTKPIQMIVAYAPGGATDIIYRLVAEYIQKELGQPMVIVNIDGAAATNGSRKVKDSAPDGYTILGHHDAIATAYYSGVVNYAFEAFEPICLLTATPNIATTSTKQPWKTMKELLDDAKKRPGEIVWSATMGSTDHFYIMGLLHAAGVPFDTLRIAGYQGTGQQITALLGGHVAGNMTNVTSAGTYIQSGDLRFLGVAAEKRLPQVPDVPTLKEQGINFTHGTNRGVFAPKGTPKEIVDKLAAAFKKVMGNPEVIKKIEDMGSMVDYRGVEDYKVFLDETMKLYGDLAKIIEP